MRRLRCALADQRGSALLFTTALLVMILVFMGMAIDLAYQLAVKNELQRSMDAAALAGAGKLGFDATVFPTARQFAQTYAALNPYHDPAGGTVNLNLNPGNSPTGDIVLGIWDSSKPLGIGPGQRFEPSLDGTLVNAVLCRYRNTIRTTFLPLLGFPTLPVYAEAFATANPPQNPPDNTCLFPIGLGDCPFNGKSSLGCGVPITFISSSGKQNGSGTCVNPPCSNTAGWVNLDGTGTPNAPYLKAAIQAAGAGNCPTSPLTVGSPIGANNGMIQSVFDTLAPIFVQHYNASAANLITLKDANGNVAYGPGQGWEVYLPVITTGGCPAQAINGTQTITGWTKFVMTQIVNHGQCQVANHYPNNLWDPICPTPNGTGTNVPNNSGAVRAVFGYFECDLLRTTPNPVPAPRSALATRLRIVW